MNDQALCVVNFRTTVISSHEDASSAFLTSSVLGVRHLRRPAACRHHGTCRGYGERPAQLRRVASRLGVQPHVVILGAVRVDVVEGDEGCARGWDALCHEQEVFPDTLGRRLVTQQHGVRMNKRYKGAPPKAGGSGGSSSSVRTDHSAVTSGSGCSGGCAKHDDAMILNHDFQ